ncbi:hypothetical protein EMIT091MI3_120039 [Kosakonia quasisacchari]
MCHLRRARRLFKPLIMKTISYGKLSLPAISRYPMTVLSQILPRKDDVNGAHIGTAAGAEFYPSGAGCACSTDEWRG